MSTSNPEYPTRPEYLGDPRPAGHIPEEFHYRTKQDTTRAINQTNRPQSLTHLIRAQHNWGLAPLGYIPAKIVTWTVGTDTWQPQGTDYGYPYLAIHWGDTHDFYGQWHARVTVIVSDPPHNQPKDSLAPNPDESVEPGMPRPKHSQRSDLSDHWTDTSTGLLLDRQDRSIDVAPGVPVYTTAVTSETQFRDVLAAQDLILFTDPAPYLVAAALLRR